MSERSVRLICFTAIAIALLHLLSPFVQFFIFAQLLGPSRTGDKREPKVEIPTFQAAPILRPEGDSNL